MTPTGTAEPTAVRPLSLNDMKTLCETRIVYWAQYLPQRLSPTVTSSWQCTDLRWLRTNHSAQAVSITHPHAGAQEYLYKKVMADACIDPHDVSYVEMHGTGTQAGDSIEMTSVTNTFAPEHRRRRSDQPLHLGAIKANVGHAEASSGVNSLIKVCGYLMSLMDMSFLLIVAQRFYSCCDTTTFHLMWGSKSL